LQDDALTVINEDCFFLNIFVPQRNESKSLFPVLIHIHGGSFQMGSSHSYPALALASTGLVVVTFNYRLGLLGFFPSNTDHIPTNIGMMDQILVMEWVQRHISRFYGNSKDVTIMGESAGAASVAIHLVSPKVKYRGLFSKAIIISGSDMAPWASLAYKDNKSENLTSKLADVLGCKYKVANSNDADMCLRNVSSYDLLDAVEKLEKEHEREMWTPVIDENEGVLLRKPFPNSPSVKPSPIPLLIGVMDSEASIHATYLLWKWFRYSLPTYAKLPGSMFEKSVLKLLKTYGIQNSQELLSKIIATYNCSGDSSSCHKQLFEVFSDFFCNAPTYRAALEQAKVNPNVFFFSMTHRSPKELRPSIYGTYHGTEIPYIFGYPFLDDDYWPSLFDLASIPMRAQVNDYRNPKDIGMARLLISLWSNFIKTGNPTPDTKTLGFLWTPLSNESRPYLNITNESKMMYNYRQRYMKLWTPDCGKGAIIVRIKFSVRHILSK
uniref:COesterase domain-containing protein n=1 Tax=Hymenolepis diminuta TaxID=6216 RepID=A0A0R3SRZ5_HYMDI